ncbi:hypothetical protein VNO77_21520 [Canavalia gladiata]|uniref:Uncharacterized protein n=1 Tax=Canavalia gladiata TaxID=3824 RepID=A0AAN9LVW6_CANGL
MSIDEGISFGLYKAFQGSLAAGCKTVMLIHYINIVGRNQLDSCLAGNIILLAVPWWFSWSISVYQEVYKGHPQNLKKKKKNSTYCGVEF